MIVHMNAAADRPGRHPAGRWDVEHRVIRRLGAPSALACLAAQARERRKPTFGLFRHFFMACGD